MIGDETTVELPVDGIAPHTMDKVLAFLDYHAENPMATIRKPITCNVIRNFVGDWDADFIALENDQELLVSLILAANYLNCQSLLDLGLCKIATMIKDQTPEEVKKIFNIDNDITPEEEKLVRDNNLWVFELGEKKENVVTGVAQ